MRSEVKMCGEPEPWRDRVEYRPACGGGVLHSRHVGGAYIHTLVVIQPTNCLVLA